VLLDRGLPPLDRPLRIGLSPRFLHKVPAELGFKGKKLQYLEQSIAHWLMTADVLVFMIPSLERGGVLRRSNLRIADYVETLDALVLQGGADVDPFSYGEEALRPEWSGDDIRDAYEIELLQEFIAARKPVLGVCRGLQLINVAFEGTLYQDIHAQCGHGLRHYSADAYDQHFHDIELVPGSGLAGLYGGLISARVNSIHHQAVKRLGRQLVAEAVSVPDDIVEAIRWQGGSYVVGVQWHPEFHDPADSRLLDGSPLLAEFLGEAEKCRQRHSRAGLQS